MEIAAIIAGGGAVGAVVAFTWWIVRRTLGYVDRAARETERAHKAEAERVEARNRADDFRRMTEDHRKALTASTKRVRELEEAVEAAKSRLHKARERTANAKDHGAVDAMLRDSLQELDALSRAGETDADAGAGGG